MISPKMTIMVCKERKAHQIYAWARNISTHGGNENGGDTSSEDAVQEDRERFVDDLHILAPRVCADEPDHVITIKIEIKWWACQSNKTSRDAREQFLASAFTHDVT
jgi:hypothetical protein